MKIGRRAAMAAGLLWTPASAAGESTLLRAVRMDIGRRR